MEHVLPLRLALLPACLLLGFALLLVGGASVGTDAVAAPDDVLVPDIRSRTLSEARRRLEAVGLKVGAIYEISWDRILASAGLRFPVGYVYRQAPAAGARWPVDRPVRLAVSAVTTGNLPVGLLDALAPLPSEPSEQPADEAPLSPAQDEPPAAPPPAPAEEPGTVPAPADGPPSDPPQDEPREAPPEAIGSPDAPRPAPPPDASRVPSIIGLELAEAEQLIREAKMTLYVEREPGHPIGRVLEQTPPPHAPRPAGGVVKIVVTAGGDFAGAVPAAPDVYVPNLSVPDLLDRTELQAQRILRDLGLVMQREQGKRGPAGRVVDQMPAAGGRSPKGGVVRVWIAPAAAESPAPKPPGTPATPEDEAPAPKPPLAPGPLAGGVPKPLSPGHGTELPQGDTVPVGFTWRGVKGAQAYIVEVEEEGAEGHWLPSARKPSRKTAVLVDIERLGKGRLRWRVRAVIGGREGSPSRWVTLK